MRYSDKVPVVNAGSMADIAFLLLIFFLVTTTIPNDKGIIRKLPPLCPPGIDCTMDSKERNILRISINEAGELLVNDDLVGFNELADVLKMFIDNNGDSSCLYCLGTKAKKSSENPQLATIAISAHRNSPYKSFIAVQDEVSQAYFELRDSYVKNILKQRIEKLSPTQILKIQEAYPFRISEASIR